MGYYEVCHPHWPYPACHVSIVSQPLNDSQLSLFLESFEFFLFPSSMLSSLWLQIIRVS